MTELEHLAWILKSSRMDKKHEDWGFPRGWNEALDFVELQISKLNGASHGASRQETNQPDHAGAGS